VVRTEGFLDATKRRRLADLETQHGSRYLSEAGRDRSLAAWLVVQIVDAIRVLGVVAGAPWVEMVDWGHSRASAGALAVNHPTVVREYGPEVEPAGPMTDLAAIWQTYQEFADRLESRQSRWRSRCAGLSRPPAGGLGLLPVFAGGAWDKGYLGVWLVVGRRDASIRTPAAAWGIVDQPMSRAPEMLCPLTY